MFIDFRAKGRVKEKHQSVASICAPTGDWTWNSGTCPHKESNPQPSVVQDDTPANWGTWPGQHCHFFCIVCPLQLQNRAFWKYRKYQNSKDISLVNQMQAQICPSQTSLGWRTGIQWSHFKPHQLNHCPPVPHCPLSAWRSTTCMAI